MAMIAAVAFLAVPAALYMANPEFTCFENETEPELNYHSGSEEEEVTMTAAVNEGEEQGSDDREDKQHPTMLESTRPETDRLLKAAEAVFGPSSVRSAAPPVSSAPKKWEDVYKREHESAAVAPTVAKYAVPTTPPAQQAEATPLPYTPATPVLIMPLDNENGFSKTTPRRESGSSAYNMRLSHLQQQQAIYQQHQELLQTARSLSPQKHLPNRSADASRDKPASNGRSTAPSRAANRDAVDRSAPTVANLQPLPPPNAQVSPLRFNKAETSVPTSTATEITPVSGKNPSAALLTAEPYLTPRAKKERALAELRRQEEEQRNQSRALIQNELSRAMEEMHEQETIQREEDEHQRHLLAEEHHRREAIQKTLLEERQRIHREEEQRRVERRRLQDEAEEQRLADQRAIADVLIEVENERIAEENRLQEQMMNRVERQLKSEEQRQHEILEQLRLQNQYPYPRTHSSAILTALSGKSPSQSPSVSPTVSPNSSFRVPRSPTASGAAPVANTASATTASSQPSPTSTSPLGATPEANLPSHPSSVSPTHSASEANRLSTGSAGSNRSSSPNKPSAIPVRSSKTEDARRLRAEQQRLIEQRLEERRSSNGIHSNNSSNYDLHNYQQQQEQLRSSQREAHHESPHHRESDEQSARHRAAEHHLKELHSEKYSSKRVETTEEETVYETVQTTTKGSPRATGTQLARGSPRASPVPSPHTPQSAHTSRSHTPKAAAVTPQSRSGTTFDSQDSASEVEFEEEEDEAHENLVLHARDELALHLDTYIRSQKKFCSSAPLKYKCPVSKIVADCEKQRKAYNSIVREEVFKVHNLLYFMEKNPRFAVSGGRQMVGVTHLTPFQSSDTRRVFGNFKCSKCMKYWLEKGVSKSDFREWSNAYSYKDCHQTCHQCDLKVYPYMQRALKKTELHFDDRLKHDVNRCSRCEALRKPCYEYEVEV